MNLSIRELGPINNVNINLGDLTLLIGPQASGKSLTLQMLKLLLDKDFIIANLEKYGYSINNNKLLAMYLGEGLGDLWAKQTRIELDKKSFSKTSLKKRSDNLVEKLFYIPAQRILSVNDGRPKNFMEFDNTTPYVLRYFSESIRLLVQNGLGDKDIIFPIQTRLKTPVIDALNNTIFHDSSIVLENRDGQKKMRMKIGNNNLPFMTWSAGQKEFTPLLMGLYCVSGPPNRIVNKDSVEYVVVEEPEMGLHPWAILSIMLQALLLIGAGKKVIISTHSSIPLEFAWAYRYILESKANNKTALLGKLFNINKKESSKIFKDLIQLNLRTYYFSRGQKGVVSKDITELNVGSEDKFMSEWGGLTEFSSLASEVVNTVVNYEEEASFYI